MIAAYIERSIDEQKCSNMELAALDLNEPTLLYIWRLSPKSSPQTPPTPPYLEPHHPAEPPKAQQALMSFLRKVFPGQSH